MTILAFLRRALQRAQDRAAAFKPSPGHCYLVSFPKSGNTWARFLLAHVAYPEMAPITFQTLANYIPDSCRAADVAVINDPQSPFSRSKHHFVKTHSNYSPEYRNIIYIVRDGRDALTSYYHWLNARREEPLPMSEIIKGSAGQGSWSDHVLGWVRGDCDRRLVVKYEDMLRDTEGALREILAFAGIEADQQTVKHAVEESSFEKMKSLESDDGLFDGKSEVSRKMPFIRKGVKGDWKSIFTKEDIDLFWELHRPAMELLQYGE